MAGTVKIQDEVTKEYPSLHPPDERIDRSNDAWSEAPSREVTGDDPEGLNAAIERERLVEENAPGVEGVADALVDRERRDDPSSRGDH